MTEMIFRDEDKCFELEELVENIFITRKEEKGFLKRRFPYPNSTGDSKELCEYSREKYGWYSFYRTFAKYICEKLFLLNIGIPEETTNQRDCYVNIFATRDMLPYFSEFTEEKTPGDYGYSYGCNEWDVEFNLCGTISMMEGEKQVIIIYQDWRITFTFTEGDKKLLPEDRQVKVQIKREHLIQCFNININVKK